MAVEVMTQRERDRLFTLVGQGLKLKLIAERLGLSYDRVRHMVQRAEERGEVPAGTLLKLGVLPKKVVKPPDNRPLTVHAPARRAAARLGCCAVCTDSTEVVITVKGEQLRLCANHATDLAGSIGVALHDAATTRARFNGRITS